MVPSAPPQPLAGCSSPEGGSGDVFRTRVGAQDTQCPHASGREPRGDRHSPRAEAPRAETPGCGNSTVAGDTRTPTSGPARDEQELDNPTGRPEHARSSQPLQTTAPRAAGDMGGTRHGPASQPPALLRGSRTPRGSQPTRGAPSRPRHAPSPHHGRSLPEPLRSRRGGRRGSPRRAPPRYTPGAGLPGGGDRGRGQHDFAPPLRGHAALWTRPPRPASTLIGRFESRRGWVGGDVRGVECVGRGRGGGGAGAWPRREWAWLRVGKEAGTEGRRVGGPEGWGWGWEGREGAIGGVRRVGGH